MNLSGHNDDGGKIGADEKQHISTVTDGGRQRVS